MCRNCGYTFIGKSAPLKCPVCAHPQSYVAVTDVDFAGNFVHSTLDGVNLSTATTQTYEKSYVEDDAKAGETLGSSTDDLTAAATGSGEAETTEAPAQETVTEETPAQEETPAEEAPAEEICLF